MHIMHMLIFLYCAYTHTSLIEEMVLSGRMDEAAKMVDDITDPCELVYVYFIKKMMGESDADYYLMASEGHSEYFPHIYAHRAFFGFGISGSAIEIAEIYFEISKRIVHRYITNKFTFRDKTRYENIPHVPSIDYLINLINSGDRKAEETYIGLLMAGQIDPKNEIDNLKRLSELGNGKAMTVLGNLYYTGHGVEQCLSTAMHFFRQGAAHGDPLSYNGLGKIFMKEEHKDVVLAKKYFERAASRGSAEGDYNLYMFIRNIYKIEDMGLSYLVRAVKRSYMPALYYYAKRLFANGDVSSAISHLVPICDFDTCIVDMQERAQDDYVNGRYTACLYKLLFLSETGSINSINNLLYLLKVKKNIVDNQHVLFHQYCYKLALMGQTRHLVDLADTFFYGRGTQQSYTKAFSFYYAAMLYKSARGSYSLSYMYEHGLGCTRSISDALAMLHKTYRYDDNAYLLVWYTIIKIYALLLARIMYGMKYLIGCIIGLYLGYMVIVKQ